MTLYLGRRFQLSGPRWDGPPWFTAGQGCDEYGNCSLYLDTPLFGVVWFYPTGHFQRDVELPEMGECPWADWVYGGERPVTPTRTDEMRGVEYDREVDAAYIHVSDGRVARTEEVGTGTRIDRDADGAIVGVEVIHP